MSLRYFSHTNNPRILRVFHQAVNQGLQAGLDKFIPTVALKTGALRLNLRLGFLRQLTYQTDSPIITLFFPYSQLSLKPTGPSGPYAQYHVIGWNLNPRFLGGYQKPTTPGTRPIDAIECLAIINSEIQKALSRAFRQLNLDFTLFIFLIATLLNQSNQLAAS